MAVIGADFSLKALILQSIVGVFTPENILSAFWFHKPSMGSLKTFCVTDVCHHFRALPQQWHNFSLGCLLLRTKDFGYPLLLYFFQKDYFFPPNMIMIQCNHSELNGFSLGFFILLSPLKKNHCIVRKYEESWFEAT